MDELSQILKNFKVKDFKISGNKVMIKKMVIDYFDDDQQVNISNRVQDKILLSKIKNKLYVETLVADFVPKCVVECNNLQLRVGSHSDNYLPKVKELLYVYQNYSEDATLEFNNFECKEVLLNGNKYEGSIKANSLRIGDKYKMSAVGDLDIEGTGSGSTLTGYINNYRGDFRISNVEEVILKQFAPLGSSSSIIINNCDRLDLTDMRDRGFGTNTSNLKLNKVVTLEVLSPFLHACKLKVDRVVFSNSNFLKYNMSGYRSVFECKEFVLDGVTYTKRKPHPMLTNFIKFK